MKSPAGGPTPAEPPWRWRTDGALLILALALPALVYVPITRNYFNSDDFLHLYRIVNGSLAQFLLNMHGGHLLMTRNALFVLSHALFGTNACGYFWLVLLTHLVNVFLLFRIIRELTGGAHLACFGAALWGILPVQEGTLGGYSVYGQVVATTLTLWVLLALVRTACGARPHPLAPLLWVLLLLGAATSFGVGIGVACVMPLVAVLLLPMSRVNARITAVLTALAVAMPFLYFRLQKLYVDLYGGLESSLLLVAGLNQWHEHLELLLGLIAYGILSTVVGVFDLVAYPGIAAYAVVAAYGAALIAALATGSWILRRRLVACLALCTAAYAVIAAGRGMFAVSAETPRYHYLGTAPLAIATCLLLAEGARRWRPSERAKSALLAVWLAATVAFHFAAGRPIDHFAFSRRETDEVLAQIRRAARSVPRGEDIYIENRTFHSVFHLTAGQEGDFPGWAAVFVIYFPTDVVEGRRVHFVEDDPSVLESTRGGRRTAGLLVSPEAVPGPIYRAPKPAWARRRAGP